MALSVPLFIVALFHCLKVTTCAPMPFWPYRGGYAAAAAPCGKYGKRCNRNNDCSCKNEYLQCNFVFLKGRKECMPENKNAFAMVSIAASPPSTTLQMCFKHQHECYHDNDCECKYGEYLYCKQLSMQMKGLCLTQSEDIPLWFIPISPAFKPSTTTSPNPVTTPTSPATTKWQCENLDAKCIEDIDCLCEHSDELWCIYDPERQDHYCMPEEWNPTDHPPTSPRGTQPPPITKRCGMFAFLCSSDMDCFCEESDGLRCVYVHEEKESLCLPDDWNQRGPPTHEHPQNTTKHTHPTTKPLSTSNIGRPFTLATNLPTNETSKAKDKSISVSERPWNPSKSGTSAPNGRSDHGGNPYTETSPITKSPWNFWGTKTISVGKKKGDHITLTASKKLMLNVPVQSLHEVINELDENKLIK